MNSEHERAFLEVVRMLHGIGYGRMMQIISHEWHRHDPNGAALANTCYGLLSEDDRRIYEAIAIGDPLFKEDT